MLVARDDARLGALGRAARRTSRSSRDLATETGAGSVEWRLGAGVDLLVNNAGLGSPGAFDEPTGEAEEHLLRLNVRAVLRLAHAALPPMLGAAAARSSTCRACGRFAPTRAARRTAPARPG